MQRNQQARLECVDHTVSEVKAVEGAKSGFRLNKDGFLPFRSVGLKLQFLLGVVFMLGLAAVLGFQMNARLKSAWQERIDANLRIVNGLSVPARMAILQRDKTTISSYMELLTSDPRAAGIVLAAGDKVMASQQSIDYFELPIDRLAKQALDAVQSEEPIVQDDGGYEYIAVPIKDSAFRTVGSIAVAWSVQGLLDNVWETTLREAAAFFLVGAAVLLALFTALRRLVTNPLKRMAALLERNFGSDAVQVEEIKSNFMDREDEIGTFARALGNFYRNAAEMHHLHGQLDNALTNMSQGLCMIAEDGLLLLSNARFAEIYGLQPEEVKPGCMISELNERLISRKIIGRDDRDKFVSEQISSLHVQMPGTFSYELADQRSVTIARQPAGNGGWVITHTDVTELRAVEKQLLHLAKHDPLTDLPNRRHFIERIDTALKNLSADTQFAVLFLDLDRFKAVNDTLGHAAGDEVLKTVAQRLQNCVSDLDTVCRLGGDEFAILHIHYQQIADAEALAVRITRALAAPIQIGRYSAHIGVSTGISLAPAHGLDVTSLLKAADIAVYAAKSAGKNTHCIFDPSMTRATAA